MIYRAVKDPNRPIDAAPTTPRAPSNVPFFVDNGDRPDDARNHSDVKALTTLVLRQQLPRAWFGRPARERWPEAVLFMPCASAAEVDAAISASELLDAAGLRDASRFWSDVEAIEPSARALPHRTGEIFFEGPYELLS